MTERVPPCPVLEPGRYHCTGEISIIARCWCGEYVAMRMADMTVNGNTTIGARCECGRVFRGAVAVTLGVSS